MDNNESLSQEEVQKPLKNSEYNATNDVRKAIYDYEIRSLNSLQWLNGGGAALLVGFLSKSISTYPCISKTLFLLAVIFFVVGLLAPLAFPHFIYSNFIEARYSNTDEYKKLKQDLTIRVYVSIICFIVAIILALIGWGWMVF